MGKDLKGKELGKFLRQKKNMTYSARYTNRFGRRVEKTDVNLEVVEQWLLETRYADSQQQSLITETMTLNEWFFTWMETYKDGQIRENTKSYYLGVFKRHIAPTFGFRNISEIREVELLSLIREKRKEGYGYETLDKIRAILQMTYKAAMRNHLAKTNPAKGINLGPKPESDARAMTVEEQALFFNCCNGTFFNNLFVVAVTTGLRPGEVSALTEEDFNLEEGYIDVTKTLTYVSVENKKLYRLGPPKTLAGKRRIPIVKQCKEALESQILLHEIVKNKELYSPVEGFEDLIFTSTRGKPITSVVWSEKFREILDAVNLQREEIDRIEGLTAHSLRHTFATRCFEKDMSGKAVQTLLGHKKITTTMDIYTSFFEEYASIQMQKLEDSYAVIQNETQKQNKKNYDKLMEKREADNGKVISFEAHDRGKDISV